MLQLRLTPLGLGRVRFGYSPLAEVTSSVRAVASGRLAPHHAPWYDDVRGRLDRLDWTALSVAAPYRHMVPGFTGVGVQGPDTSIGRQLKLIEEMPAGEISTDVRRSWQGEPLPGKASSLIADRASAQRIANALWEYWSVAMEPYWPYVQAALDDDLSRRLDLISKVGLGSVLPTLDTRLQHVGDDLVIHKRDVGTTDVRESGLYLIPSVFVWPSLAVASELKPRPSLIYAARSARQVWRSFGRPAAGADSTLGALIGVSRATILRRLELCHTTAALADDLGMSRPAVNQHLTLLKRSGMVQSRRIGKRVIYQRTGVGEELIAACPERSGSDESWAPTRSDVTMRAEDGQL